MAEMKRYAEQVSIDMGLGGEITGAVLIEADKRLRAENSLLTAIRDAARRLGWTNAEIARRSGLSPSQVSRIMAGKRRCSCEVAQRLATAVGVSVIVG
jgi:ribosome-binding protein aMBF1 (putative translation factor)